MLYEFLCCGCTDVVGTGNVVMVGVIVIEHPLQEPVVDVLMVEQVVGVTSERKT